MCTIVQILLNIYVSIIYDKVVVFVLYFNFVDVAYSLAMDVRTRLIKSRTHINQST